MTNVVVLEPSSDNHQFAEIQGKV